MNHFTNPFQWSHADLSLMGRAMSRKFTMFPLMLLMLLLLPTRMVAQIDYDKSVTFTALAGSPEGYTNETYANLFDGKKTEGNSTKWCCDFYSSAYVIFAASKAGIPVGYTITTGNDNSNWNGRNPLSWKLYGNNEGKDGAWTLIQEVSNDTKLQDKNFTSYDFTCEGSTFYKYFKWEISATHSGKALQVGEFELKLITCSHKNVDGSSALGAVIKNVDPTCVEHGYTTKECSICHSIVKVYKDDELKPHTLTLHAQKNATCTETGKREYWQCSVCEKLFSDANATTEITDAASLDIPTKSHQYDREGTCIVCGVKHPRCALFNNLEGITDVTITDNGSYPRYPWLMLDLNAKGMKDLGFTIPEGSTGLMSSNYNEDIRESVSIVKFRVEKPILLTFKSIVSSDGYDKATITLDSKTYGPIGGIKQIEIKEFLSVGEHTLTLCYKKDISKYEGADRALIYNLKTATTISDYVAKYDATNITLTFKKVIDDNISDIRNNRVIVDQYKNVKEMCTALGNVTIKNIVFDESFKTYAPTSLKGFFENCKTLEKISGLEYLNTANVTDMNSMFYGCSALTSLDLTKFNTANVTTMRYMFKECSALNSLNLTKFNTARVTDMGFMFYGCSALTSLDLTKFNTARVTDMNCMFYGCYALKSLDLTNFNTENVTDMNCMFFYCNALKSLDLTKFNTANVTDMESMFQLCKALESLDLTNFNTANVTGMRLMFYGCSALTTIYASDNFKTEKVGISDNMFWECNNLKGFIEYNKNNTDLQYANYKTGYFTKLVGKNGEEKIGAAGETLTAESLALDDNKDFVAYEPFAAKSASYSRTMNAGTTWATLCLPFEVSLDGKNFRAFKLLSADEGTETVELEEVENNIPAGTPVIIKMTNGATELKFTEANKNIAKDVLTTATADGYQLQGLYTQKEFSKDADNNCYIVKGNKLMNPAMLLEKTKVQKVASKPFRAYMVDNSSAPTAGAKMFSIGFDNDGTTAIDSLNTIADDKAEYYDLQGKRLNEPQKGINIVKRGGKTMKVIIK